MAEPKIPDISALQTQFDFNLLFEKRMANDANGNPEYVGWARPGTGAGETKWFITKQTYDGNNAVTRQQIANDIPGFIYEWDERATYFS